MVAGTAVLLFLSSCSTAIIHALIPDHWLPFALMGRAQAWSERRTLLLAGLTGIVHVTVSIVVGIAIVLTGSDQARKVAERLGASVETLGGGLLIAFGLAYGLWAHARERRAHASHHAHAAGAAGHEVHPGLPLHAHGHLLSRWAGGALTGAALVAVIGISPCVLFQPILFAAAAAGTGAAVAAAAGFATCTVGTMIVVTWVALRGMRHLSLGFFTRYGDLLSGLIIAALGVAVIVGNH
jgi:nickel/cobalt transporter (NicO) family protein